jgi:hypothetical protein
MEKIVKELSEILCSGSWLGLIMDWIGVQEPN